MNLAERLSFSAKLMRYLKDPQVVIGRKLLGFASAFYVVWPLDLIPDVPVVGWLDDLGVVTIAAMWMVREVNRHAKARSAPRSPP